MIKRSVIFAISFMALVGCKTADKNSGADLAAANKSTKGQVRGYDFTGFKVMNGPKAGMMCTQEVKAEQEACMDAQGQSIWADNCKVMCSVPILDSRTTPGKAYGFSFKKLVVASVAGDEICAQVVKAEEEACREIGGRIIAIKGCQFLCSKPIAAKGRVSGYNFSGPVLDQASAEMCTTILRPEEDACSKVKGTVSYTGKCEALCSEIIN